MTDVWVSMGDNDANKRDAALRPFQVDAKVMAASGTRMRSSCIASPPIAAMR